LLWKQFAFLLSATALVTQYIMQRNDQYLPLIFFNFFFHFLFFEHMEDSTAALTYLLPVTNMCKYCSPFLSSCAKGRRGFRSSTLKTPSQLNIWYRKNRYCEFIYIRCIFNFVYFVGRAIHEFKIPTKYFLTSKSAYNLKSMNSSVHEHV